MAPGLKFAGVLSTKSMKMGGCDVSTAGLSVPHCTEMPIQENIWPANALASTPTQGLVLARSRTYTVIFV